MNLTPRQLIKSINSVSDEFFKLSMEMGNIAERKGTAWLELRSTCKTNAECDQKWSSLADGKRENYLRWYLKGLQAKRGALMMEHRSNTGML